MKCKDIPDLPILQMLADRPDVWHDWSAFGEFSVLRSMPPGTPQKLALAKMKMLIKRGLVDGCGCGCRGNFYITEAGQSFVETAEQKMEGLG